MENKIVIKLSPTGKVEVEGPLENKLLCYGLLEAAKDAIRDYKPSPILKPLGIELNGDLKDGS